MTKRLEGGRAVRTGDEILLHVHPALRAGELVLEVLQERFLFELAVVHFGDCEAGPQDEVQNPACQAE